MQADVILKEPPPLYAPTFKAPALRSNPSLYYTQGGSTFWSSGLHLVTGAILTMLIFFKSSFNMRHFSSKRNIQALSGGYDLNIRFFCLLSCF